MITHKIAPDITLQTPQVETFQLSDLLRKSKPITVLHFQNSFRRGQTCSLVMPTIEQNLEALSQYANVAVIVRETPFDVYVQTAVPQYLIGKSELSALGVLGPDGYVERTTLIVAQNGEILATLPADDDDRLEVHFAEDVLPFLKSLKSNS